MSPSLTLVNKTPYELWFGKNPSLTLLIVFHCKSFSHIPKGKRTKLDNKVAKCIFIYYKEGMKGYNISNIVTRKIVYG